MKDPEPTLPPEIPPIPSKWKGTVDEWIRHRQEGNDSVQEYFERIARSVKAIQTDENGIPIITAYINPQSGMLEQTEPNLAQELFSNSNHK